MPMLQNHSNYHICFNTLKGCSMHIQMYIQNTQEQHQHESFVPIPSLVHSFVALAKA
jgi:polyphosphate kinase